MTGVTVLTSLFCGVTVWCVLALREGRAQVIWLVLAAWFVACLCWAHGVVF